MSDKILTVIVPSYNMEKYLPKCLGSLVVAPELLDRLEVLVVNDGSKDRTSEIAHEFEAKYPRTFKVIDKPNGHYGSCVNTGILEASGEFVRVLDADDYCYSKEFVLYLQKLKEPLFADKDVDVIFNNYNEVNPGGEIVRKVEYAFNRDITTFQLNDIEDVRSTFVGLHAIAYRTSMLRSMAYRQTEGCAYTDTEWFTIPMSQVRKAVFVPLSVICYLVGREGQSMESEAYIKGFGTVADLTRGVLRKYSALKSNGFENSSLYFTQRVLQLVSDVYRMALIGKWNQRASIDIADFDDYLKTIDRYLYETVDADTATVKGYSIKYVKEWRKRRSDRTLRFVIYRIIIFVCKCWSHRCIL